MRPGEIRQTAWGQLALLTQWSQPTVWLVAPVSEAGVIPSQAFTISADELNAYSKKTGLTEEERKLSCIKFFECLEGR